MGNPDAQDLLAPNALAALGNTTLPIVAIDSAAVDRNSSGQATLETRTPPEDELE
jgi:hypothetical protein